MDWRPIETAPTDGTPVLVWADETQADDPENNENGVAGAIQASYVNDKTFVGWLPVFFNTHGCGCCGGDPLKPIAWMELPERPGTFAGDEEK